MGGGGSQLRNRLKSGDETGALRAWDELMMPQGVSRLTNSHTPELSSVGEDGNTLLHLAAWHAMPTMMHRLLDSGLKPSDTNALGRNVIHLLCDVSGSGAATRPNISAVFSSPPIASPAMDKQRADLVDGVLEKCGELEIDGRALCLEADNSGMLALHVAAQNGLYHCSVRLLNQGSCPFTKSDSGATACDVAISRRHHQLATLLSSRMYFSFGKDGDENLEMADWEKLGSSDGYKGLQTQEIIEIKDKLLLETADMLNIPLHAAAVLLRHKNWSREALMMAWLADSRSVLKQASLSEDLLRPRSLNEHSLVLPSTASGNSVVLQECAICLGDMAHQDSPAVPCGHRFCADCWKEFLAGKIEEGASDNIPCPSTECDATVPVELVDHLMPQEMRRRYEHFDVKAFVAGVESLRWCPKEGCSRAVQIDTSSEHYDQTKGAMIVDCGTGHIMCWSCAEPAHEPCSCDMMREWREVVEEMSQAEVNADASKAAQQKAACDVWLADNAKPCPKCSAPIERTHGCNHMTCQRCRHEFCWMCQGEWKLHSNATGGYFRCNRDEARQYQAKRDDHLAKVKDECSSAENQAAFSQQYKKICDHQKLLRCHYELLDKAKGRVAMLVAEVAKCGSGRGIKSQCLREVFRELVVARLTLAASCVYMYFLQKTTPKRRNGEPSLKLNVYTDHQRDLETATEDLCKMVTVPYIQCSQPAIVKQALLVRGRRVELIETVLNGILPPGVEDDFDQAIARDQRPLRLPSFLRNRMSSNSTDDDNDSDPDVDYAGIHELFLRQLLRRTDQATCERQGCSRPRSGTSGHFCSGRCRIVHQMQSLEDDSDGIMLAQDVSPLSSPPRRRRRSPAPVAQPEPFQHSPPYLRRSSPPLRRQLPQRPFPDLRLTHRAVRPQRSSSNPDHPNPEAGDNPRTTSPRGWHQNHPIQGSPPDAPLGPRQAWPVTRRANFFDEDDDELRPLRGNAAASESGRRARPAVQPRSGTGDLPVDPSLGDFLPRHSPPSPRAGRPGRWIFQRQSPPEQVTSRFFTNDLTAEESHNNGRRASSTTVSERNSLAAPNASSAQPNSRALRPNGLNSASAAGGRSLQPTDVHNIFDNAASALPAVASEPDFDVELARAIALSLGRNPDEAQAPQQQPAANSTSKPTVESFV